MNQDYIPLRDRIRYFLTKNSRTENFYRDLYEQLFSRYYSPEEKCLRFGPLCLPQLSMPTRSTREETYYAMEIGDILFPALFRRYGYVDEGPYEWGNVRVAPGDIVFDCGANFGVFSLLAAYRGGEVFAFEPIQEARNILKQTLALNPSLADQVHIVPYALGAKEETAEFTILADTLIGSSMVLPQIGRKIRVPMTTVDAFTEAEGIDVVNFVKADIEGAERQMLIGAASVLRRCAPKIAICKYHLANDGVVLAGLLREANPGYMLNERWKKIYGYVPSEK